MRKLPPLTAIRALEAVGRYGVQRAASELNVTPAAVYHQIRTLESDLDVQLFTRDKGKGLTLTRQGEQFLAEIIAIFDQLYASVNRVKSDAYRNELTLDVLTSYALGFLLPRLHKFVDAHPDIEIKIITPKNPQSRLRFAQTGAQVAIRGGAAAAQWPDMHAEMLGYETMFPVCAPQLLEGPNGLKTPADIANFRLIDVVGIPEGWSDWLEEADRRGHDVGAVRVDQAMKLDLIHMSIEAAAEGMGVTIGRAPLVNHMLASGKLVVPFDFKVRSTLSYWLITPDAFAKTAQFQKFRSWLFEELEEAKQAPGLAA